MMVGLGIAQDGACMERGVCKPAPLAGPPRRGRRLAAGALALALGQSREEARKIVTLKEVEPLIEAKYRLVLAVAVQWLVWLALGLQELPLQLAPCHDGWAWLVACCVVTSAGPRQQ